MPIKYEIRASGHYIHAIAEAPLTGEEFVDYEVAHANDRRIAAPLVEVFEIRPGACDGITKDHIDEVLRKRSGLEDRPVRHRCAIVIPYLDSHAWDIAEYYQGMARLHFPETVIVFGDMNTAGVWLGIESCGRKD